LECLWINASKLSSVEEWLQLPELSLPVLINAKETGAIYMVLVLKFGFLLASKNDCKVNGLDPRIESFGKCILPTIDIESSKESMLFRLPLKLASWAFDNVALANTGMNHFPSKVEFGVLDGRT